MRRVLGTLVLAAVVNACAHGGRADPGPGLGVVVGVVDGDTIDVEIQGRTERVRLIGIDTPETGRAGSPAECHGPEASAFTAGVLAPGAIVRIERDIVGRDHYGRLLGYVHLVDDTGHPSTFVNLEIVRRGHATPMSIEPNTTFARVIAAAARAAEADDLGLWAACSS